jgi:hypothetical protein
MAAMPACHIVSRRGFLGAAVTVAARAVSRCAAAAGAAETAVRP